MTESQPLSNPVLRHQPSDFTGQKWEVTGQYFPNTCIVDLIVIVREHLSESDDSCPASSDSNCVPFGQSVLGMVKNAPPQGRRFRLYRDAARFANRLPAKWIAVLGRYDEIHESAKQTGKALFQFEMPVEPETKICSILVTDETFHIACSPIKPIGADRSQDVQGLHSEFPAKR